MNKQMKDLGIFALGGLGEIGKNTYCIEYMDELLIIDAGIKFPTDDLFGIDYVIPDYTYLVDNQHKIKGIFITHGHEDHIGGIPYLLKRVNVPIYAGKLAIELIKERLKEHDLVHKTTFHELSEGKIMGFGQLEVDCFRTTHSIPDSYGIVVHTPLGNIVHTGDFKFDLTPIGPVSNLEKIAAVGKEGVLCLLSDSTNSEIPGYSLSESKIKKTIHELFGQIQGRIIFATFASNMYRFQQAIDAAVLNNRKIVILGRSLLKAVKIGSNLGYLKIPDKTLIEASEVNHYPDDQILVICTGSQGEPFAALSRIAYHKHPQLAIKKHDTVIFSSSPIPGNTLSINKIINQLSRSGAHILHHRLKAIHTSGHGAQEELKLMLTLLKPKFFVPIHGEYKMLKQHVKLAQDCGIPAENSYLLDNGMVLEIAGEHASFSRSVPANAVYVDGEGIGDIGTIVLRDRQRFSQSGVLLVVVAINFRTKEIVSGPEIISRGFVFIRESDDLIRKIKDLAHTITTESLASKSKRWNDLRTDIVEKVEPYVYKATGRRPMILPIFHDISKISN